MSMRKVTRQRQAPPSLEDLRRWRSRMGLKLHALVKSQEDKHPPVRCLCHMHLRYTHVHDSEKRLLLPA